MSMNTAERFLTIVGLCSGILVTLGTATWKITRTLNRLLDLPGEVREVVDELKKMNTWIAEVRGESIEWRRESKDWHRQHLEQQHRQRGRP